MLDKDLILIKIKAESPEEIIKKLAELMLAKKYVKESYLNEVLKREKEFPTGLPTQEFGVAIPHTDSSHVNRSAIAIATLEKPVIFKMMGSPEKDVSVRLVMLIAIDNPNKQLKLLKNLMEIFQDNGLLEKIYNAEGRDEILKLLEEKL